MLLQEVRVAAPLGPSELRDGSSQWATLLLARVSTGASGWSRTPAGLGSLALAGMREGLAGDGWSGEVYPSTCLASSEGEAAVPGVGNS